MKDELGGKIMTGLVTLRAKTFSYLTDDCKEDKKAKGTKKSVIKRRLKFSDLNSVSSNDDKRLQTFDRITSYPYGASAGKVCKTELLSKVNIK